MSENFFFRFFPFLLLIFKQIKSLGKSDGFKAKIPVSQTTQIKVRFCLNLSRVKRIVQFSYGLQKKKPDDYWVSHEKKKTGQMMIIRIFLFWFCGNLRSNGRLFERRPSQQVCLFCFLVESVLVLRYDFQNPLGYVTNLH